MRHLNHFELILNQAKMLNARVRHLEFIFKDKQQKFSYLPGQFISLLFQHNMEIIRRNFSIANQPIDSKIEIAVTHVPHGIASTKLHQMEIGETIKASGPFGIFLLDHNLAATASFKRYILVATGTGVTPYRAMLASIGELILKHDIEFWLLLGVRNKAELLYSEDFINFKKSHKNFKFIPCYSREILTATNPPNLSNAIMQNNDIIECSGYVQDHLEQLNLNPDNDIIYLCGNPNMIDQALIILEKNNIPKNRIKREKYISSK